MSELRIVRGNTFFTRSEVTAKTYAGDVIDDFDLSQATDIKVNVKTEYKATAMEKFDIDEKYINIKWKGLSCGRYGLEVSGIYNGIEWRFYNRFVLAIVESNAEANIPEDSIIREDYYSLDAVTHVLANPYDDTAIRNMIKELSDRVAKLEGGDFH